MRAGVIAVMAATAALVFYIGWHLWRITPWGWPGKVAATALFVIWTASFFAAFTLPDRLPLRAGSVLYVVGHTWMIAFLYLLIIFLLADLAAVCGLLPKAFLKDSAAGFLASIATVAVLITAGRIHYHKKYREEITVETDKPVTKTLTIVLASDLHLGYHNGRRELSRWVDLINTESPDLVLFGGDVVDRSLRPLVEGGFASEFRRINAPIYTILGNHEYYSSVDGSVDFFADAGINLLKDASVSIEGVKIIGRDDRSNPCRTPLHELVKGGEEFTILLDHQPSHLEEAEEEGIDFQFSGHTHRGQVWPASWVTDVIFEKSWGHHHRGNTRYYISSGLGIWGARIRIGTRSEYMVLHIVRPQGKR